MAKGVINDKLSGWLIVALIVASLFIEVVLHHIEHWINHRHQHLQAVVKVLYRELMILGLISFLFVMCQTIVTLTGDQFLSFEFAHFLIFMLAVFYTFVVLSSMFTSLRLSARWKKMEQVDLIKYLHLKEQYNHMRHDVHRHKGTFWRRFWWWFPNFLRLWSYVDLHEMMAFHDIRFQFIYYRNLPEDFRFSSFLRKIKSITFVNLVESHWSLYVLFLIMVLIDLLRRHLTDDPVAEAAVKAAGDVKKSSGGPDVVESVIIITATVLIMAFVQILAFKIRSIYWELTKNPRTYYEGVHPAAVAEELAAAKARLEEERSRRRRNTLSLEGRAEDPGHVADDEATDVPVPPSSSKAKMLDPLHMRSTPMTSDVTVVNIRNESEKPADVATVAPNTRPTYPKPYLLPDSDEDSLKVVAARHSLDYTRAASSRAHSTGHSMDVPSAEQRPSPDHSVPPEIQGTSARHSLESPQSQSANLEGMRKANPDALVAKAAVEAARRRTAEFQFGRGSLDNQRYGDGSQRPGEGQRPGEAQRASIEVGRRIGSPRILSRLSSRPGSTEYDGRGSSEYGRRPSGLRDTSKRSIELKAALPHDELAARHHELHENPNDILDIEAGIVDSDSAPTTRRTTREGEFSRSWVKSGAEGGTDQVIRGDPSNGDDGQTLGKNRQKSLRFINSTIIKNIEHQEKAKNMEPSYYPRIVIKLIPRLGRVASPVENLFWFGSHRFFFWCVEFCLFFSTVLLAASSAVLSILTVNKETISGLNIASLVLSLVALLFVLLRIAGIIKKYIFILHNAGLVPEALAIETIHTVTKKSNARLQADEGSDLSGSETEREEGEAAAERRRTLGRFFRSEAESGNMPGFDPNSARVSLERPQRRVEKRKIAFRRRTSRLRSSKGQIPSVPSAGTAPTAPAASSAPVVTAAPAATVITVEGSGE